MSSVRPPLLFVAQDEAVVIISTLPLRISGGRAEVHRTGPVVAISPVGQGSHGWTRREVCGFGVLGVLLACAVSWFGGEWWLVLAVPGAILQVASMFVRSELKPASVVAPDFERQPEAHRLLMAAEDRQTISEVVEVVGRICAAWPTLGGMIDVVSAEHALARIMFNLSDLLARRQRLRQTRDGLRNQSYAGLPANNPAVRSLTAQMDRTDRAMSQVDAEISRRIAALEKTANASEIFISEEALRRATRDAEQVLAEFDHENSLWRPEPSTALTEEFEAVLTAYRELINPPDEAE